MIFTMSNLMFNLNSLLNPVLYFLFTRQFKDFVHSTAREVQLFTLRRKNAQDLTALGVSFGFLVPSARTGQRAHSHVPDAMIDGHSPTPRRGELIHFCPAASLTPGEQRHVTTVMMMHSPTTV